MKAIYRRELSSYFMTPVGYIYLGIFLGLGSLVFALNNLSVLSSDLSQFFAMMSYVWMLLTPILVMRLIAGERKNLTDQLIITAPVKERDIVLGKYCAAVSVLLISVALSFVFPLLIFLQSRVYPLELMTLYLGFTLQGCAFIAFDLMVSAFFKNPITAAISTFGVNLFLWLMTIATSSSSSAIVQQLNSYFSLYDRFSPFLIGQLSFANILYFLVFSLSCLFLTTQIFHARRWAETI